MSISTPPSTGPAAIHPHGPDISRFFGNSAKFWMGLQIQYDLEREQDRLADRIEHIPEYIPRKTPDRSSAAPGFPLSRE